MTVRRIARLARVIGIAATVHEADAAPGERTQSEMLDIHDHNGQLAPQAAGLFDELRQIIHEGGEATRVLDTRGAVLCEASEDATGRRPASSRGACSTRTSPSRSPRHGSPPSTSRYGRCPAIICGRAC